MKVALALEGLKINVLIRGSPGGESRNNTYFSKLSCSSVPSTTILHGTNSKVGWYQKMLGCFRNCPFSIGKSFTDISLK